MDANDAVVNADQTDDRQRIVNALAMHTFGKLAEGEEMRVYDIRTDSMWLVSRKDGRMAWREDPKMEAYRG